MPSLVPRPKPPRLLLLPAALALIALADAADAQSRDDAYRSFDNQPDAGVSIEHALSGEWQRIEFFAVPHPTLRLPDGRPWIGFAARRWSGRPDEPMAMSWTTPDECPALRNTLVWLTTLVAPRIEIPGITPNEASPEGRRPKTVTEDGLQTSVWGRGTQPDHIANTRVEISSNGGLIAEFGRAARDNLAPCWRPG